VKTYYEDRIEGVARYRVVPPPQFYFQQGDGWGKVMNGISGLRLSVTDEAIEVRGFGPFRRVLEGFGRVKLSLPTRETDLGTVRLRRGAPYRAPWAEADYVALSYELPSGVEYSLAIRPLDGDLERLRAALRTARDTRSRGIALA
jgi:hypothetical protein